MGRRVYASQSCRGGEAIIDHHARGNQVAVKQQAYSNVKRHLRDSTKWVGNKKVANAGNETDSLANFPSVDPVAVERWNVLRGVERFVSFSNRRNVSPKWRPMTSCPSAVKLIRSHFGEIVDIDPRNSGHWPGDLHLRAADGGHRDFFLGSSVG